NISNNFRNVTFEVVQGQMVIDPVDELTVFITENSGSYVYDGTEKAVTGYTISTNSKVDYTQDDFDFTGNAEVKGVNAGTYEMELGAKDFANTSKNFTKVNFVIVDGMLTISPVTDEIIVTITGNGGEHTYDGTEKTIGGYTVSIDNPLYDEDDFDFTGEATAKGTDAGIYDMEILPEDFKNTNDNFSNIKFVIAEGSGQLVINAIDNVVVTIRENGGQFTYDGAQKAVNGYTVANISNPLYKETDFSFKGSAVVTGIEAGAYSMDVKPEDFINHNTNFGVVNFVVEDGQLVINPVLKYSLTIRYVDTAGNAMSADYTTELEAGASFNIESPRINGYTPNYASVNSSVEGMPATNLIITVVYTANPAPVVPNPTPAPQEPEAAPPEPQVIAQDPEPTPVATPVEPAPVPEVQETVEEEPEVVESVDIQVVVDEEGNIKLVPIGAEEAPLANINLGGGKEVGDHYCNIASLLLMLAAMAVLVAHTKRMKKMQAKVLGLKAQLEDRKMN
ncbi:MAG: MucBP domain-containing protein, partial [Lachnospiraceae bacterium]|nr:MucBP domain-containing protein [Lachnospiraceae bacterium]